MRESINPDLEMDIPVKYTCNDGNEIEAELKDVHDAKSIMLEKGNHTFMFDNPQNKRGGHTVQDYAKTKILFHKIATVQQLSQ